MFSPSVIESAKIIDTIFIAGMQWENITKLASNSNQSISIRADILFSLPENKELITNSILDFVFPNEISIEYSEQSPKFYAIVLTNENGIRSYIYILKIFEKIPISEILPDLLHEELHQKKTMNPASSPKDNKKFAYLLRTDNLNITSNTTNEDQGKMIYFPYAICLWSTISRVDSFKQVITEIFKIITYNNNSVKEKTLKNYRLCELLHTFIFISNILKPSSFSTLNLLCRFSTVEFYFPSVREIPCSEYNIKVLFDCLEISTIIRLWCSLLSEKHIIILANQSFLLFSICEALLSLMFPFKWLHTYIPVLPNEQIDYLESPTPYIMGVLSSRVDYFLLKEKFPNSVICDANTSIISKNGISTLPVSLEAKLRKKLQYMKNPKMYQIEEIENPNESQFCNEYSEVNFEDISNQRSFSENIHYIFFRIFRNPLKIIDNHFTPDKIFDVQSFLEEFCQDDMREFWEKIVCTVAFEHFIVSFQYLDDSFSRTLKQISKNVSDDKEKLGVPFRYNMTLPSNVSELFADLESKAKMISLGFDIEKYTEKLLLYRNDYFNVVANLGKERQNLHVSHLLKHRNSLSMDLEDSSRAGNILGLSSNCNSNEPRASVDNKVNARAVTIQRYSKKKIIQILHSSENCSLFFLNKRKNTNLRMYGNSGFLTFVQDLFSILTIKEISEIGYHSGIIYQIHKHIHEKLQTNLKSNGKFSRIEELEQEENDFESIFSGKSKSSFSLGAKGNAIIEIKNHKCFQYYLLLAFHLTEFTDNMDQALKLYKLSYQMDKASFPRVRFYLFLDKYDYHGLNMILTSLLSEINPLTKESLLVKIVKSKIVKYQKNQKYRGTSIKWMNKSKKDLELAQESSKEILKDQEIDLTNFHSSSSSDEEGNSPKEKEKRMTECAGSSIPTDNINGVKSTSHIGSHHSFSSCKDMKLEMFKSRKISVQAPYEYQRKSFLNGVFDGRTDAEKIMELLKVHSETTKDNKPVKLNLINVYAKVVKTRKDPIGLSEDIAVKLLSLLLKNSLNKYKTEMISNKLLTDIANCAEFQHIKELVAELQKVNLGNLTDDKLKMCFWLNIYNFLTIFTIIYKKEVLLNYYEWYRFLKNSYYSIGGFEVSLYEIENCILTHSIASQNIYGEVPKFNDGDKRKVLLIEDIHQYAIYSIAIPTKSSTGLRIYFPNNLYELMKLNAIEYFSKSVNVDLDNNILLIPEFLVWVDNQFFENLPKYEDLMSYDFFSFLSTFGKDLNRTTIKAMNKANKPVKGEEIKGLKNIIGNYRIDKTIGEGTFGKVKLGFHIPTEEQVAIKILEKDKIQDKEDLDRISREIYFLKKLKHPNIIKIYEIVENTKNFYLIMEYATGGELFTYIVNKKKLDETEASYFYYQILNGLEYIHKNRIVHRDLKPENLLLTAGNVLKIIDFGLSNQYRHGQLLQTPCGSPCYAAPEMILGRKYHGLMVDLWSTGIILYAMICGYLPFEDKNNDKLYKKILECKLEWPDHVSSCCKDLITKILTVNPAKRIKLDEILHHPFLKPGEELFKKEEIIEERSKMVESVLEKMVGLGFDKTEVLFNIENNKHNNTTTTYDLLLKKFKNSLQPITDKEISTVSTSLTKGNNINISINTYNNIGNINININDSKPVKFNENANNRITQTGNSTVRSSNKRDCRDKRECSVNVRTTNTPRMGGNGYKKMGRESSGKDIEVKASKEEQENPISLDLIKKNKIDTNVIIGGANLFTPVNHRLYDKLITANKEIDLTTEKHETSIGSPVHSSINKKINTSISYDSNPLHFDSQKATENPKIHNTENSINNCNSVNRKYIPSNTINLMEYSVNRIDNPGNLFNSNDRKRRQMKQSNQHKFSFSVSNTNNEGKVSKNKRSFSSNTNEDNCRTKNEYKSIYALSIDQHAHNHGYLKKANAELPIEEDNERQAKSPQTREQLRKTGNLTIGERNSEDLHLLSGTGNSQRTDTDWKRAKNLSNADMKFQESKLGSYSPRSKMSPIDHKLKSSNGNKNNNDPNKNSSNNVTQVYFPVLTDTLNTSQTKFKDKIFPHSTRHKTQLAFQNFNITDKTKDEKCDSSKAQKSSKRREKKVSEFGTILKLTENQKSSSNENNPSHAFSRAKSPGGGISSINPKKIKRKSPAVVDINISDAISMVQTSTLKSQSSGNHSHTNVSNNVRDIQGKNTTTIIHSTTKKKAISKINSPNNLVITLTPGQMNKKTQEKRVINIGVISLNKDQPHGIKTSVSGGMMVSNAPEKNYNKSSTKGNSNSSVIGSKVYAASMEKDIKRENVQEKTAQEEFSEENNANKIFNFPVNNNSQISDFAFCTTNSSMEEIEIKLIQFCTEFNNTLSQVGVNQYHCKKDLNNIVCIEISKMGQNNNVLKLYPISGQEMITKDMIKKIIINVGF